MNIPGSSLRRLFANVTAASACSGHKPKRLTTLFSAFSDRGSKTKAEGGVGTGVDCTGVIVAAVGLEAGVDFAGAIDFFLEVTPVLLDDFLFGMLLLDFLVLFIAAQKQRSFAAPRSTCA